MSKAQLYDILCQMKALIEQNQQEARQILIDNPLLTRALFQAQIMLGMVQSPKVMSNTQQAWRQPQPAQVGQPQIVHSLQTVPAKVGEQSEPGSSQSLLSARQQHPTQPSISVPPASVPPLTFQWKAMPLPLSEPQTKGFLNLQVPSVTPIQSSQIQNISQPNPAAPHYSNLPSHMPMISVHPQQTLQNPGLVNQLLQPPLPLQPRQVAMQPFALQFHPRMPHSLGLQPSSAPQQLLSQPLFHTTLNCSVRYHTSILLPTRSGTTSKSATTASLSGMESELHGLVPILLMNDALLRINLGSIQTLSWIGWAKLQARPGLLWTRFWKQYERNAFTYIIFTSLAKFGIINFSITLYPSK
ncbi:cleavage stimulating factor 64-like isoform X1 [Musa acuminata AAA Group]|uniref:cleavage stimulating factor 64-like isoform X1 n=1 Tax=Musa acuminata AAA Group TaxID=214697 RepID=UPI0031D9E307